MNSEIAINTELALGSPNYNKSESNKLELIEGPLILIPKSSYAFYIYCLFDYHKKANLIHNIFQALPRDLDSYILKKYLSHVTSKFTSKDVLSAKFSTWNKTPLAMVLLAAPSTIVPNECRISVHIHFTDSNLQTVDCVNFFRHQKLKDASGTEVKDNQGNPIWFDPTVSADDEKKYDDVYQKAHANARKTIATAQLQVGKDKVTVCWPWNVKESISKESLKYSEWLYDNAEIWSQINACRTLITICVKAILDSDRKALFDQQSFNNGEWKDDRETFIPFFTSAKEKGSLREYPCDFAEQLQINNESIRSLSSQSIRHFLKQNQSHLSDKGKQFLQDNIGQ